ncbi:MAG: CRISPR-associated protein Cas5 [Betaproteobacteria bacterium]|nr:CRISPR-associated protein Cas5 [Betaproteobacteria bacterium]
MLRLRVRAPFAVFRGFAAGSFRPSAPFITYSAAYGLLLNLAGQEMRAPDDGKSAMTLIAADLPRFQLAMGVCGVLPTVQTVYQQLHNYPVGNSGKEREACARGNKYNITPARRVMLHRLDALLAMQGDDKLEADIRAGLAGQHGRYGLPFLGDNNFLPDRIDEVENEAGARWLLPLEEGAAMNDLAEGAMRLTLIIDRADMSRTESGLFRLDGEVHPTPPLSAWTSVGY